MQYSDHIKDLITAGNEMRKDPAIDKEWLNRTLSHLKSAYACSKLMAGTMSTLIQKPATANFTGISRPNVDGCLCVPGAKDRNCPVHA